MQATYKIRTKQTVRYSSTLLYHNYDSCRGVFVEPGDVRQSSYRDVQLFSYRILQFACPSLLRPGLKVDDVLRNSSAGVIKL